MPYKNYAQNFDYAVADAYVNATSTQTGDEVDASANNGVITFIIHVHAIGTADGSNYFTFTVNQATSSGGTYAAANSNQYLTVDSWDRILNATTETGIKVLQFFPARNNPYLKLIATETGTADITYSAICLFDSKHQPASS